METVDIMLESEFPVVFQQQEAKHSSINNYVLVHL